VAESATSLLPHPGGGTNVIRVAATNVAGINLDVESGTSEPGLYHTTFVPRETGGYLAEVTVTDASGVEVGRAEAGWTSDPAADEFRSLQPNRALLEMIARQTGGEVVPAKALDSFAAGLPMKKAPIVEASSFPLWHTPALFVFALLCFVAEWGLRRWKGMA
jgi:hypothetical protein